MSHRGGPSDLFWGNVGLIEVSVESHVAKFEEIEEVELDQVTLEGSTEVAEQGKDVIVSQLI